MTLTLIVLDDKLPENLNPSRMTLNDPKAGDNIEQPQHESRTNN